MLAPGDRIPEARAWVAPREEVGVRDLARERRTLFFFYLFDWSAT